MKNNLSDREKKELIAKYEKTKRTVSFKDKKVMYLRQTDRNYKDGDRN